MPGSWTQPRSLASQAYFGIEPAKAQPAAAPPRCDRPGARCRRDRATRVFLGEGKGVGHEPQHDTLEEIIAAINERFGTDLDERDRLEVEKVQMTLNADEQLKTFARANAIDNFALEFGPRFKARSSTPRPAALPGASHQPGEDDRERGQRSSYHAMREEPEGDES